MKVCKVYFQRFFLSLADTIVLKQRLGPSITTPIVLSVDSWCYPGEQTPATVSAKSYLQSGFITFPLWSHRPLICRVWWRSQYVFLSLLLTPLYSSIAWGRRLLPIGTPIALSPPRWIFETWRSGCSLVWTFWTGDPIPNRFQIRIPCTSFNISL